MILLTYSLSRSTRSAYLSVWYVFIITLAYTLDVVLVIQGSRGHRYVYCELWISLNKKWYETDSYKDVGEIDILEDKKGEDPTRRIQKNDL